MHFQTPTRPAPQTFCYHSPEIGQLPSAQQTGYQQRQQAGSLLLCLSQPKVTGDPRYF